MTWNLKQKHDNNENEREKVERKLQPQRKQAVKAMQSTSKKGARHGANKSHEVPQKSSGTKLEKSNQGGKEPFQQSRCVGWQGLLLYLLCSVCLHKVVSWRILE